MQMILFTGIPGSGKSTFYQQHFFHTHLRVNLDMLRTRNRENRLMQFCFDTQLRFVVDNTNVKAEERQKYIQLAREYKYSVTGFYFQSGLQDCLERDAARMGRQQVGERGLLAKYYQLQIPALSEGYDQLFYVQLTDGKFVVNPWQDEIQ